jgi:hypothetical protein
MPRAPICSRVFAFIRRAVREFLSGDARREEFQAILRDAQERYSVALEKLADL